MFRVLYFVVVIAGLLWILQTRPIWLQPTRAMEEPPRGAQIEQEWQRDESTRMTETMRRTWITVFAVAGVIAAGEVWCLVAGRLKWWQRP